jgi:hypothetical protein
MTTNNPDEILQKIGRNRLHARACHDLARHCYEYWGMLQDYTTVWKAIHPKMPRFDTTYPDYTTVSSRQRRDSSRIIPNVLRFLTSSDDWLTVYPRLSRMSPRCPYGFSRWTQNWSRINPDILYSHSALFVVSPYQFVIASWWNRAKSC